jgi:hypothetical protein
MMGLHGIANSNTANYKQGGQNMNHSFALNNFKNQPTNSGYPAHQQMGAFHLPNKNNFARLAFTANNFYDAKQSLNSNNSTVN